MSENNDNQNGEAEMATELRNEVNDIVTNREDVITNNMVQDQIGNIPRDQNQEDDQSQTYQYQSRER